MNQYKKSRLVVIGSIVIISSLFLLFLTVDRGLKIPYLSNGITNSISFLNKVVSKPVQLLSEQKDNLTSLMRAYDENKELKKVVSELENQLAENESLKSENASLRESLAIAGTYANRTLMAAMVATRTPVTWTDQLIIDIGQSNGVKEDMLVMANGGLVGVVTEVFNQSATVRLLSNANELTKIPIKITTNSGPIYGVLSGYDTDSRAFIVNQLNDTGDIPEGSTVVTSDLTDTIAPNLQVGKVLSVKTSSSDLNRELYVEPTANFSTIYAVMVVGDAS